MDTIKLRVFNYEHNPCDGDYEMVEVLINERSLLDWVDDVELSNAKESGEEPYVNRYAFLGVGYFLDMLTQPNPYVLGCTCTDPGCDPVTVHVKETENSVVWGNFCNPSTDEEYSPLRFEFDKTQYFEEMQKIKGYWSHGRYD